MCGIFGYFGEKPAFKIIFDSLKKLEYRGYDSWGIVVKKGKDYFVKKAIGKLENAKLNSLPDGNIGIGHCRWATNGSVSIKNAHPHFDCSGKIAVVHNGIVENYEELKNLLKKKRHKFRSDTDTEVIPHLIEEYLKYYTLENAIKKVIKDLKGKYAVLLMHKDIDGIFAFKNGNSLIIGIGEGEKFISSDVAGFIDKTEKAIFPKDSEIWFIGKNVSLIGKELDLKGRIEKIKYKKRNYTKGKFEDYMLKEIFEQKDTIKNVLKQDKNKVNEFVKLIKDSKKIIFTGCGTAYHACLISSIFFSNIANKETYALHPSQIHFYRKFLNDSIIIAISQSGETADVLNAVGDFENEKLLSIVNVETSSLARKSRIYLPINAGPEIAVAATKSFTNQIALTYYLANLCVGKSKSAIEKIKKTANGLKKFLKIKNIESLRKVAKFLAQKKNIFIIGNGINYPVALEGALKIKEVSYVHAEGLMASELRHGPIALIEKEFPCIVIYDKEMESCINELKSRSGHIIGVSTLKKKFFNDSIILPKGIEPILNTIPFQILAYWMGKEMGYDVDKPRNLTKSVTVK